MKQVRRVGRIGKVSPELRAAARELARELGIRPLQPGERRPPNFYVVSHFSGKPIIKDRNAVVRE